MKIKIAALLLAISASFSILAEDNSSNDLSIKNVKYFSEQIITGGQPTEQELAQLKAKGVTTIINLRGTNEFDGFDEEKVVKSYGMEYVALPISGAAGVTKEAAEEFAKILEKENGKTFIHCASGNRVGALTALKSHFQDGLSIEQSIEIGKKAGLTGLENKVLKIMEAEKSDKK